MAPGSPVSANMKGLVKRCVIVTVVSSIPAFAMQEHYQNFKHNHYHTGKIKSSGVLQGITLTPFVLWNQLGYVATQQQFQRYTHFNNHISKADLVVFFKESS